MKDHILSEAILKQNLLSCMYCSNSLSINDSEIQRISFITYVNIRCNSCKKENRVRDKDIKTIEDLIEKIKK